MSCQKILIAFAAAALIHPVFVMANEGDVVNLSAALTMMHDNNLFRLAPSANPASFGIEGRSDTITMASAGLNLNKMLGRQQLIGNINFVDTSYQRNAYLDYLALNYDGKWLWAVGTRWTGELALDRAESLNTFADYTTNNYQARNVRLIENERFTANYWFHTSWAAFLGVSRNSVSNEQAVLAANDYEASGFNYGIRFRPVSGNTVALRVKQLDGSYSNRPFDPAAQFDNGFSHRGVELDTSWLLTGKTQLRSRLEYLERKHDHFAARDYSGWAGNLDLVYAATGKSSFTFGYKHDLVAFQQATSSYYELDELNLGARWAATDKISTGARLGYGKRSYRGEIITLPAGVESREDKITRAGLDIGYKPARWLELKAGMNYEKRNTNNDRFDYKDRTTFVSLNAQY
ncbi:MAG: putative exosortase B-associated extracellular polysaccharide biosynthesis transporter EpsL [Azonexus sp.]|nr:putative exosortase B-associated extracellular polysaccharide biosynthesis transporter EpsL [Azonexus sp.]